MRKFIVILYSKGEQPPGWLRDVCQEGDVRVIMKPLSDVNWSEVKSAWAGENTEVWVMAHGLSQREDIYQQIRDDPRIYHFDYSSADFEYEETWRKIREAKTCGELIAVLNRWILLYDYDTEQIIDPLRRIKHRAINLFGPISVDFQHLLELWKQNRYEDARKLIEEMLREWEGEQPFSRSPCSMLARLWYMLVGEGLDWRSVGIPSPKELVSLPKSPRDDREKCLYEWLSLSRPKSVDDLQEWRALLEHVQLVKGNEGRFCVLKAGIFKNTKGLQQSLRAFLNCGVSSLEEAQQGVREFLRWYSELNLKFEELIQTWPKGSSS